MPKTERDAISTSGPSIQYVTEIQHVTEPGNFFNEPTKSSKHRRHWEDRPWWRDPPDRKSLQLARLFQQPDLENHWVPMRNRALSSVMAFVAQATQPAGALLRDRQAAA
jgi:hypothetical protein